MKIARVMAAAVIMIAHAAATRAAEPGKPRLALTPPMGWNSWEPFRQELDERAIREQADAMVKLGLRDAGYTYFVIDGGWKTNERAADGSLVADPKKFPSGIKAIADYVHERKMKFGLHQPAGVRDCMKLEPGSEGNEERDAKLFASWGVDFIKYDQCDYAHDPKTTPGSPDLDKIIVRQGERVVATIEAEAPQNHLTGLVQVQEQANCSGGKCVVGIGYGNGGLEIPDVQIDQAGRYSLDVEVAYPYFGQNRDRFKQLTFFVSVNGKARQRVDLPYALAKRYTVDHVTIDVDLQQGHNTIWFDNPSSQEEDVRLSYVKMAEAMEHSGRDVMFCTSGASRPWLWARPIAHLFRTSGDLADEWSKGNTSILATVDRQAETLKYTGLGFWADPDALQVGLKGHQPKFGNPYAGMNDQEYRAHFSLWAIMSAPLFISADLRHADEDTLKILMNHEVIAIDQDALGTVGQRIRRDGDSEVFAKRVTGGCAVVLLNRAKAAAQIRVSAAELGLKKDRTWHARDLWSGATHTVEAGVLDVRVEGHAAAMFRLEDQELSAR